MAALIAGEARAQDAAPVPPVVLNTAMEATLTVAPEVQTSGTPSITAPATEAPAAQSMEPQGFQVARLGDSRMSCEALIGEINRLNGDVASNQTAMTSRAMDASRASMRGPTGVSMASTALTLGGGVAAALVPGAGLAMGLVQGVADRATEAAVAAHAARQERQMDEMMNDMAAGTDAMMPIMSRIDHLTNISIQKGC